MERILIETERLILANQFKLLSKFEEEEDVKNLYDLKIEILEHGYEGSYDDVFEDIYEGISFEVCEETHEILRMFEVIHNILDGLPSDEKEGLQLKKLTFEGFDGNNDRHYHYARFLVKREGMYESYNGNILNSHSRATIDKYRRMLNVYKEITQGPQGFYLGNEELQQIINVA